MVPLGRSRPVLVLVLDGMDAGVFEELCEDLKERGWQRQRGPAPAAVLAVLPTVTESSRMALMTGRVGRGNAAAEKAGFARHRDLRGASLAGRPPLLFHKGDLTGDAAEGLAAPVRNALRDGRQRIVGIVLNAVDDHLAKSEQLHLAWRVDSIRLLPTILTEAHAAGRVIVLTSDHGHVLEADGVKLSGDAEGRWRRAASPAKELEIEIEGSRVQAATGQKRIVVPWSETVRYGSEEERVPRWGDIAGGCRSSGRFRRTGREARRLGNGCDGLSSMVVCGTTQAATARSTRIGGALDSVSRRYHTPPEGVLHSPYDAKVPLSASGIPPPHRSGRLGDCLA